MKTLALVVLMSGSAAASPRHDIDGDGFDDAVLDHQLIYYGSATGLQKAPTMVLPPQGGRPVLFYAVELVGDVNGDGFADVVYGDPGCPPYARDMPECAIGKASVYFGGKKRIGTKPDVTVSAAAKNTHFGMVVVPLGDIDGDKLDDVAVPDSAGIHIYKGAKTGWGKPIDLPGNTIQPIGDIDKDGKIDLLAITPQAATIYYGGDLKRTAAIPLGGDAEFFGVAGSGDFDGDGYGDVAITVEPASPTGNQVANDVLIYKGSAAGLVTKTKVRFTRDHVRAELGGSYGSVGDLDGDKFDDLVIVATCSDFDAKASSCTGMAAYVYKGSAKGLVVKPIATLKGNRLTELGDVDGDKHPDFQFGDRLVSGAKGVTTRAIPAYP